MGFRFPGTLSARIILGFAVVILTFGIISANTIFNMDRLDREIRVIRLGYLELALRANDLAEKQVALQDYLRAELPGESRVERVQARVRAFRASRDRLLTDLDNILAAVDPPANHRKPMKQTRTELDAVRALVAQTEPLYLTLLAHPPIERAGGGGAGTPADAARHDAARQALAELLERENDLKRKTDHIKRAQTDLVKRTAERLEGDGSRFLRWLAIVLGAVGVGVGLLVTVLVALSLRPLRRLQAGAQRIAEGDYASRIEERGPSEVADLAREFNVMAQAVDERQRELVRTERLAAVGKMAATIAHEVRNPLSSIGLNTELLEEELGEVPADRTVEARALCRAITTEVDRLTQITETYLNFARLPKPRLVEESLNGIVTSLVQFEREPLALRGVNLEAELAPALPPVAMDENQIRQALLNLLRNAAEALEEIGGGHVTVSTCAVGGEVEVRVTDDGPGITDELAAKLFDPFFSTKEGGTGLGLALTHQIVGEHGGRIRVVSSPGHGATFVVTLPAAPE